MRFPCSVLRWWCPRDGDCAWRSPELTSPLSSHRVVDLPDLDPHRSRLLLPLVPPGREPPSSKSANRRRFHNRNVTDVSHEVDGQCRDAMG